MTAIIEVQNLYFSYGPQLPEVLRGVNFALQKGEFVALLGQNGAGKTTLAKHFNGLNAPTRGTVAIQGRPVAGQSLNEVARTVGYCYQNPDHQTDALRRAGVADTAVRRLPARRPRR